MNKKINSTNNSTYEYAFFFFNKLINVYEKKYEKNIISVKNYFEKDGKSASVYIKISYKL